MSQDRADELLQLFQQRLDRHLVYHQGKIIWHDITRPQRSCREATAKPPLPFSPLWDPQHILVSQLIHCLQWKKYSNSSLCSIVVVGGGLLYRPSQCHGHHTASVGLSVCAMPPCSLWEGEEEKKKRHLCFRFPSYQCHTSTWVLVVFVPMVTGCTTHCQITITTS